jgi:hypothetical protein
MRTLADLRADAGQVAAKSLRTGRLRWRRATELDTIKGAETRWGYDRGAARPADGWGRACRRPVACALGHDGRLFHDPRRCDYRVGRQPVDHGEVGHRLRSGDLGDQRLPSRIRGAVAVGRPTRRPLRAEEPLPARPAGLHRRVAVVRTVRHHRHAHRGSRGAGHRSRAAHPADPVHDHQDLPRRATWGGDERVGCDRRRRHPGWATRRRRAGRPARLAMDLHRQRSESSGWGWLSG